MQHLLLKAAITAATDQGTFEAVISTATVDREKDIVEPTAMLNALTKWAELGKLVPLAWAHGEEVVGHVDPATARIDNKEVIAAGFVDQGTPRGAETWRLVKSGTLSFSFGYLIPEGGATQREGGGLQIKELDVFEISVVPMGPANNDTRVLSFKSVREEALAIELQEVKARLDTAEKALTDLQENLNTLKKADVTDEGTKSRSVDPLRTQARDLAKEILLGGVDLVQPPEQVEEPSRPEPEMDPVALRKYSRDLVVNVLSGTEREQ